MLTLLNECYAAELLISFIDENFTSIIHVYFIKTMIRIHISSTLYFLIFKIRKLIIWKYLFHCTLFHVIAVFIISKKDKYNWNSIYLVIKWKWIDFLQLAYFYKNTKSNQKQIYLWILNGQLESVAYLMWDSNSSSLLLTFRKFDND